MTPLEIMAKARWDSSHYLAGDYPWGLQRQEVRNREINNMRAALLALAEAELPHRMEDDRGWAVYPHERDGMYRDVFRIMLRAIAEEKPNDA